VLQKEGGSYYRLGANSQLRATADLAQATVFRVHRFKEKLKTKMRGVNCAGWFRPEDWSAGSFYRSAGFSTDELEN